MAKSENSGDKRSQVLEEHREVVQHVSELDAWAEPNTPRDEKWGPELSRRASIVIEHLKHHFSGEAEGSLFADIAKHAPHLMGKLTALTAEHREILAEFRQVAEHASALGPGDVKTAARIGVRARRAVAKLRRHEAEENELIFNTYWDDLGVGD